MGQNAKSKHPCGTEGLWDHMEFFALFRTFLKFPPELLVSAKMKRTTALSCFYGFILTSYKEFQQVTRTFIELYFIQFFVTEEEVLWTAAVRTF